MRPFANGMQDAAWQDRNCMRCQKHTENCAQCTIEHMLLVAFWNDGEVPDEIAARVGAGNGGYTWDCPERSI